ncbi:hypothetical protein FRB95_011934 [Tulasnella sp. JGI-2019a]|nr:hypothetical protein FRB95_011934 [Tulasnella sp. JGI-2019a]
MKDSVPYSWIKDNLAVVEAIMQGTLPEPQGRLISPVDLWSVTRLCWEIDQDKRVTAMVVLKELETLVHTVEGTIISVEKTPEPAVDTVPGSVARCQEVSQCWPPESSDHDTGPTDNANEHDIPFADDRDLQGLMSRAQGLGRDPIAIRIRPISSKSISALQGLMPTSAILGLVNGVS